MMDRSFPSRRALYGVAAVFIAALMGLLLFFSYKVLHARLLQETQQTSLERLRFIASVIEREPDLLKNNAIMSIAGEHHIRLSFIDSTGRVIGDSAVAEEDLENMDNHNDRVEFLLAEKDGFASVVRKSATLDSETVYTMLRLENGNYLRIAVPFAAVTEGINRHFVLLFYVSIGLLILVGLAFLAERQGFHKDLRELGDSVAAIAKGNFKRPVSSLGWKVLRPLAVGINTMSQTIQKALLDAVDKSCQLQTIFDSIKEGVAIVDNEGGIRTYNAGFSQLFPKCRIQERPQVIGCVPLPRLQTSIEQILEGIVPERHTFRLTGAKNEQLLISLYEPSNPTPDVRIVLIAQDITKLMQLERAQVDFVANVSHELRTPLTAIKAYAEILKDREYSEEEGRNFAGKIERHAAMLHSLVEELLSLAALDDQTADMETDETTLEECAEKARRLVVDSGKCGREVILRADTPCPVRANKYLLAQAVRNLLENACAYSPADAPITVVISQEDAVGRISVSDLGPGIPKEAHERIFERFYRLEKKRAGEHSGLGLAIAKQIAERFRGSIEVESPAGNFSTTFTIRLPLAKNPQ